MKTAGFQTVRIPVAWSNMMSTDGKYTINEKYIERVKTVVSWVLDEDMYAIVNIHWDNGWWSWFGSSDETVQANAQTKYESMWTQLASAFQQYSDHLIFESANEELGDKFNDEIDGVAGILTTAECYQKVNELNQKFVDIVRTSGGNNAMRFLLIAGYNTDIVKTCSSSFVMPTDTIENHLIVSVHYYTPWQYCTEENPNNVWGYENSWGTDDDKTEMKTYLAKMKTNFVDKGYPVIIGEYGVCATKYSDGSREQKAGRADFFQTLCEYALENGMCPVLWDTTDSVNQVYDRSTLTITDETEAALYQELAQKVAEYTSTGDNQETGSETTDTSTKAETATWEGTLEMSNWSLSSVTTGSVSGMKLQQCYGFLEISGVNWNSYSNPTLVIEPQSGAWEGNLGYSLALTMTEDNEWWYYISDTDIVKDIGNITSADPVEVSLSDVEGLTGTASLYLSLGLEKGAYSGTLKVQIVDK
jgi:endoglucanase